MAAEVLIGAEALRKLTKAHIVVQWERDAWSNGAGPAGTAVRGTVEKHQMVDATMLGRRRMDDRCDRLEQELVEARRWARHFWRQRNHSRNMAAMYKTSYAELLHAWQTRERCQTCRYYEDNGRERWCGLDSNTCAPNDFGGWEVKGT